MITTFTAIFFELRAFFWKNDREMGFAYGTIAIFAVAIGSGLNAALCLRTHDFRGFAVNSVISVVNWILLIFLIRRLLRHKKVMRALGSKSRALRAKLVQKMREARQPSPVRVPA